MTVESHAARVTARARTDEVMRRVLADVAAQRTTITYGDLAVAVFGPRVPARSPALMRALDRVCEAEDARIGARLGAVVVRADTGLPGDGYFAWAASLGTDVSDRRRAWRDDIEAVWDAYGGAAR